MDTSASKGWFVWFRFYAPTEPLCASSGRRRRARVAVAHRAVFLHCATATSAMLFATIVTTTQNGLQVVARRSR
jgi:hypothetical protein